MTRPRPIHGDRLPENLALVFRDFARYEAPQLGAHLYEALSLAIAEDSAILELAAVVPASQPPPNMLFGAVHYLLLDDESAPLRRFYRDLGGDAAPDGATSEFRSYVVAHRDDVEVLLRSRRTQTNVIQRATVLLPAFGEVARRAEQRPLALIEVGTSAGLLLQWHRYAYRYHRDGVEAARWGDPAATVQLPADVRGGHSPPLPRAIDVASSVGIDLNPVDVDDDDAVRWLRALIWPEHVERHERLAAAIEVARANPVPLVAGDATEVLPALLSEAPADAQLCVFATHALYQIPRAGRARITEAIRAASMVRPVAFVVVEGTGVDYSELFLHWYQDGEGETTHLANCNPHGRWIEWLDVGGFPARGR